jgi:hypothetical protein
MDPTTSATELILCPWQRENDEIVVSGQVTDPAGKVHTLWFRVPASQEASLTTSADPFVIGFFFPCMHWNRPVHIHGVASPSLLANLELLSGVWHQRRPDLYHSIQFFADKEQELAPTDKNGEAISCFSGGVDSCYTFWRHHQGFVGRRSHKLNAGVIVRGFVDLPLEQPEAFEEALRKCRSMLDSIGVEIIPLATNAARDLPMPGHHTWALAHGTTIGAILHLFSSRFCYGLIANSDPYIMPDNDYGTSPLTDHLMSSVGMIVRDDGAEATRIQKIQAILQWPEAMTELRVCNLGTRGGNCCTCEKCLRTIMALRLYQPNQPSCFPQPVSNHQIENLQLRYLSNFFFWENIHQEAVDRGMSQAGWVQSIKVAIRRSRVRLFRKNLTDPIRKWIRRNRQTK